MFWFLFSIYIILSSRYEHCVYWHNKNKSHWWVDFKNIPVSKFYLVNYISPRLRSMAVVWKFPQRPYPFCFLLLFILITFYSNYTSLLLQQNEERVNLVAVRQTQRSSVKSRETYSGCSKDQRDVAWPFPQTRV